MSFNPIRMLIQVMGDSAQFREDMEQDKVTLEDLQNAVRDIDISVKLDDADAKEKLDTFKAELDALHDKTSNIDLDDADAKAKLEEFKLKLDELRNQTVDIKLDSVDAGLKIDKLKEDLATMKDKVVDIHIDNARLEGEVLEAKAELDTIPDEKDVNVNVDKNGNIPQATGNSRALMYVILGLAAIAPAVLAPVGAAVGGLASAFGAATAGVTGFAAVAVPNIKDVITQQGNLKTAQDAVTAAEAQVKGAKTYQQWLVATEALTAAQKQLVTVQDKMGSGMSQAVSALNGFESFWNSFTKSFQPQILSMFVTGLKDAQTILTAMRPVIQVATTAINGLLQQFTKDLSGTGFSKFIKYLTSSAGGAITSFGQSFMNTVSGIASLLEAFQPVLSWVEGGLVNLTKRFAEWASHLGSTDKFKQFLAYAQANAPVVMDVLGQLVKLIGNLLVILAPLSSALLKLVDLVLRLANQILGANSIIRKFIEYVIQVAKQIVDIANAIVKLITHIVDLVTNTKKLSDAWQAIKKVAEDVWGGIKSSTDTAVEGVKEGIDTIKARFDELKSYFANLAKEAVSWGSNIIHSIAQGIENAIGSVKSAVSKVSQSISNFIGFHSPSKEGAGADADRWMPNLFSMMVDGIKAGTPKVQAAMRQVILPPNASEMVQAGASFAASAGHSLAVHYHQNAPVYGVNDLNDAINAGVQQGITRFVKTVRTVGRTSGVSS